MAEQSLIRLALPSKGELEESTLSLLANAGLKVIRPNPRQYSASIATAPQITVLFQRAADIVAKVDEGSVDLGITGFDLVSEQSIGRDNVNVIYEDLGYGQCKLVLAVPTGWLDIVSLADLADLSVLFKERGKEIRIATKYPNLVKTWLYEKGVLHFALVEAQGALEAAPSMGYADMIADLTTSGTTLRENQLKQISGGTILKSQACLIGNRLLLERLIKRPQSKDREELHAIKAIIELIEAHLRARKYLSITANIRGESLEAIGQAVTKDRELAGLQGPSISKVYPKVWGEQDWYAVTIVVSKERLLQAIYHIRKAGASDITVTSPDYVFEEKSWNYERLCEKLRRD